jgi:hypothetical protein
MGETCLAVSGMARAVRTTEIHRVVTSIATPDRIPIRHLENIMSTEQMQRRSQTRMPSSILSRSAKLGRGIVIAGALAATAAAAIPGPAQAHNSGGAAVALGILGGIVAGAAIAATAPPVYAAPAPYYYSQQGYYYNSGAAYYYPPQPYYGPSAGYPGYYGR